MGIEASKADVKGRGGPGNPAQKGNMFAPGVSQPLILANAKNRQAGPHKNGRPNSIVRNTSSRRLIFSRSLFLITS